MISPSSGSVSRNLDLFSAPLTGIRRGMQQLDSVAGAIANGDVSVDNMVGLIEASATVKANAAVARTTDEVTKSLLDTFA